MHGLQKWVLRSIRSTTYYDKATADSLGTTRSFTSCPNGKHSNMTRAGVIDAIDSRDIGVSSISFSHESTQSQPTFRISLQSLSKEQLNTKPRELLFANYLAAVRERELVPIAHYSNMTGYAWGIVGRGGSSPSGPARTP